MGFAEDDTVEESRSRSINIIGNSPSFSAIKCAGTSLYRLVVTDVSVPTQPTHRYRALIWQVAYRKSISIKMVLTLFSNTSRWSELRVLSRIVGSRIIFFCFAFNLLAFPALSLDSRCSLRLICSIMKFIRIGWGFMKIKGKGRDLIFIRATTGEIAFNGILIWY